MIRRESEKGWTLIKQHSHAFLSFRIMSFWGNGDFTSISPEEEVMTAIREHDFGWQKKDSVPDFNPENGCPRNFMEMSAEDQFRIWSDCFENPVREDPYASMLIALHFSRFNDKNLSKNPGDRYSLLLRDKIGRLVSEILKTDPPDGDLNGLVPTPVLVNLRFLQVGDVMSLALCHGWKSVRIGDVPVNYSGDTTEIVLTSEDGLNYSVCPNPFSEERLSLSVSGAKLPKRSFEGPEDLATALSEAPVETLVFSISAGERK